MLGKIVLGTEIYMSERFSRVWVNAAKKYMPPNIDVLIFDNNVNDQGEGSRIAKTACAENGWLYHKMMPGCLQCHSVDMLYWYAACKPAEIFVHLDIDCPPLEGVVEGIIAPVKAGASAATEIGGAHCFAVRVSDVRDMSAQRLPIYRGEKETRFSQWITYSPEDQYGRRFFDHCRWVFHDLEKRGLRVDITNFGFLHAGVASLGKVKSTRYQDCVRVPGVVEAFAERHAEFWADPRIRELM